MIERRQTKRIFIGKVPVGGGSPVSVQSMTKTDTRDAQATLAQITRLAEGGCDIIRCAVPDETAAKAMEVICRESPIPVIADIHFSPSLAMASLKAGAHGLRLNPGNIGGPEAVRPIVLEARERGVPIRVGVNAGSISRAWRERVHAGACLLEEAMVESALEHVRILESFDFQLIKIALKASDVPTTVSACRLMTTRCDYPFHVGVTESGTLRSGIIKSSMGIGTLLLDGLTDTLRVSLTADPLEEVRVGLSLLQAAGLRQSGPELISCPTCGRVRIDIMGLAGRVEAALARETLPIKVAVMGCVVNGPGEAREADVGVAGGDGEGIIFRKGEIIRRVPEADLLQALLEEIDRIRGENARGAD